jgi:teichuronic acid biosynthesis glycosyltransferase TuaH
MQQPSFFARLANLSNVVVRGFDRRPLVLAMMGAADVCLITYRRIPMSVARSPLKLHYLGAGAAVVATDLLPMRGVSERCLLVEPGVPHAHAVLVAAELPAASPDEVAAFRREHEWFQRYRSWRTAALGG